MRFLLPFIAMASLPISAIASDPRCPTMDANYQLQADRSFTAGIKVIAKGEPPVLYVHSAKSQKTYWFTTEIGNGVTDTYLYPVTMPSPLDTKMSRTEKADKMLTMSLFELDNNLVVTSQPLADLKTPSLYLFIPALSTNLWYMANSLSNDIEPVREMIPRALFVFLRCGVAE